MGLFDFLSGSDPSSDWADLGKHCLLVSLAEPSINGIELGAPANDLSRLGRPSNKRPFKEKHFRFESLGITIEIKNGLVSYFGLPVVRDPIENIGPCEFLMKLADGAEINVSDANSAASILKHLPTPSDTDSDQDETIYTIGINDYWVELEASPDGRLRRVNFYSNGSSRS